ncbi:unnamed protein product [Rotaria sp. Silwood2]|nr:unnamed protein product [Rotaria sp. Silwood2]CAF2893882.1 unnamed protein product [Rotaria sp. Silwood2]CAF3030199.1 unnamed protein product [Rotaria sp. Silwood2]CAF4387458.1 unnamed protein product [Rotaria sp. Silwood2]CAF4495230.1 unnamed protein product [Rotaria sp. Silwood2]
MRLIHSTLSLKHCLLSDQARPTLSVDFRAFKEILRMKPIPEIDPLRDPLSIIKATRSSVSLATAIPKPSHCQVTKQVFEHDGHTLDAFWVDHHQKNLQNEFNKIVLYFHGAGYMLDDIHGKLITMFTQRDNLLNNAYYIIQKSQTGTYEDN